MIVGITKLKFRIQAFSLKEKRQLSKSLIQRVQHKYSVSIAETSEQDHLGLLEIGIAIVSNERLHIERKQNKILNYIEAHYDVEMFDQIVEYVYV
ncbi:DUF503 domain-containing protein [Aerococcaceae bacterium DSM 111020]|nr:DUF503 domain-containing protein [Aerococcaceae bacterium DSM 111020]